MDFHPLKSLKMFFRGIHVFPVDFRTTDMLKQNGFRFLSHPGYTLCKIYSQMGHFSTRFNLKCVTGASQLCDYLTPIIGQKSVTGTSKF